jgi:hypothetical protein
MLPMPVARCRVSFTESDGIVHAVEVQAESPYEAVALAVSEFRQGEIITETPGPKTEFIVTAHRKPIEYRINFNQVARWAEYTTKEGPAGITRRERILP